MPNGRTDKPKGAERENTGSDSIKAKSTVFARVKPDLGKRFAAYLQPRKPALTERDVVEKVLDWFLWLSEFEQRAILEGKKFPGLSALVEQFGWAEHAESRSYETWAVQEYSALRRAAEAASASELELLATYKEALSWIYIGHELRDRAFTNEAPHLLVDAQRSVMQSVMLLRRYDAKKRQRVILYNIACGFSLLAQYRVEEMLFAELSADLGDKRASHSRTASDGLWAHHGGVWRERLDSGGIQKEEKRMIFGTIDRFAMAALDYLHFMVVGDYMPKDYSFLVKRIKSADEHDFNFVKYDNVYADKFKALLNSISAEAVPNLHTLDPDVGRLDPKNPKHILALFF